MSRVLIAGCGYVGSALAVELLRVGHEVTALRRSDAQPPVGVSAWRADLSNRSTLAGLPSVDVVYYLASPDSRTPEAYLSCYLQGTENLMHALSSSKPHFILVTSTAVYGQNNGEWVDEESPADPNDYRGAIMLEAEEGVRSSLPATAVRFGGIYGPGRTRLIRLVENGKARCSEPCRYTNRIHRDDCAGMLAFLQGMEAPEVLYLGVDDAPVSDCELNTWLADRLGVSRPVPVNNELGANKRIRNARIRDAGYDFRYPTYREGYGPLLG